MLSRPAGGQGERDFENRAPHEELRHEIARLRRLLLKHGHAQELFQSRVERSIERLSEGRSPRPAGPAAPQVRALIEFDQAVRHLLDLARGTASFEEDDAARSLEEGLDLLAIRVGNLQRSFGLEAVPTRGRTFDDRIHRVHGLCQLEELPDGQVVDEVLPGYRLHGDVVRPALVIVNRRPRPALEERE